MSQSQFHDIMPEPSSEEAYDSSAGSQLIQWVKEQPPAVLAIGAIIVLALLVLVVRALLGWGEVGNGGSELDATIVATEYAVPVTDSILIESGSPLLDVNTPISITMKGLEFGVLPYQVQADGEWHYPAGQSATAVWVYGTIVNYVIGIEQTEANQVLMESFVSGDKITMTTTSGQVYHYGFSGREELEFPTVELFAQTRPKLTLVSLGGKGETRLVVYGDFLMAQDAGQATQAPGPSVLVGEPAQLGDIRVTALSTSYVYQDPGLPEGWAFYLVDYQIENYSQEVLDPNRFRMELQDGVGNTYSVNLPASQNGTFGYLMLTIPPNTVALGTAGYLVPLPLQGPKLGWSFSRLDVPESVVKVLIDFESPHETIDPGTLAAINLSGAELSGDGTLVSVWGTVLNNSEEELVVTMGDVGLEGAGEFMALRAADPALPWSIPPGTVLSFRLAFQRPGAPAAIFTVLTQPFEISGLE